MYIYNFLIIALISFSTFSFEQSGYDISDIDVLANQTGSDYLGVFHNGKSVIQNNYTQTTELVSIQSITKSVTSLLIGILVYQGKIESIDMPISNWLEGWRLYPRNQVTIRHLLNQNSGITDDNWNWSFDDLVEGASQIPLKSLPGDFYSYSNAASSILSGIILKASNMSVTEFARINLFEPIGIKEFYWSLDRSGKEQTSGGIFLKPWDLIRLGSLLLNQGYWNGVQVISSEWIKSIYQSFSNSNNCYSKMWYLFRERKLHNLPGNRELLRQGKSDCYFHGKVDNNQLGKVLSFHAEGFGGQWLVIIPSKGIVAVRTRRPNLESFEGNHFYQFPQMVNNLIIE